MIKQWDIKSEQSRKKCFEEILTRIEEQDDSEWGIIAAQEIIDIVGKYVGPESYNAGVDDSRKVMSDKISDIDVDLEVLKVAR